MVNAISFLWLKGWHAPAGRRIREPRPLPRPGGSDRQRRWVPGTWDPADRSSRRTARAASAGSEVRPGPRLPTLRPRRAKAGRQGRKHYPHPPCRLRSAGNDFACDGRYAHNNRV